MIANLGPPLQEQSDPTGRPAGTGRPASDDDPTLELLEEEATSSYFSTDGGQSQARMAAAAAEWTAAARHWRRRARYWAGVAQTFRALRPDVSRDALAHALRCRAAAHERAGWAAIFAREAPSC